MAFMFVIGLIRETNKHTYKAIGDDIQNVLTNWYSLFLCGLLLSILYFGRCTFKYHYWWRSSCILDLNFVLHLIKFGFRVYW